MVKCHSCISEEEAGMACLSCPCTSSSSPWGPAHTGQGPSTKENVHLAQPARQDPKEPLIGRLMPSYDNQKKKDAESAEVNNNVYVNYFLHQEQQMKNKHMTKARHKQMRTNLLNQVGHIEQVNRQTELPTLGNTKQNSVEVAKGVNRQFTKMLGEESLAGKIGKTYELKQKLLTFNHDSKDCRTVIKSNAAEVSKKVEERLATMEARLQLEKDNKELRKKANLVKGKLQRCYFLMQLLPLSSSQNDYAAFFRKYKEQRKDENWTEQRKSERQVEEGVSQQLGSANIGQEVIPPPPSQVTKASGPNLKVIRKSVNWTEKQVEEGVSQCGGSSNIEVVPQSHSQATEAGDSELKVMKEEMLQMGFYQILIKLSDEGLRKFYRWKGGWSNSKDFVEKKSGASLDLKPTGKGELLIVGHTIAVKRARNMIQMALSATSQVLKVVATGVTGASGKVLEELHMKEKHKAEGRHQMTIQLSKKSWQLFADWKGGWSRGRDFVEAETGATLEIEAPGKFLLSGPEASVQRAHNMVAIQSYNLK